MRVFFQICSLYFYFLSLTACAALSDFSTLGAYKDPFIIIIVIVHFIPKRAGGADLLQHFFVISLPVVIFFALKLLDFFFFKPCARFKTIFIKNRT